jgi:hypothetical protein
MPANRQERIHLVPSTSRSRARAKVAKAVFNAGEAVPETAIYAVAHSQHQLPLQVTLRRGSAFPSCSRCEEAVEFRYVRQADAERAARFQVQLNVLPVLDKADEKELPAKRTALAG